MKTNGTLRDLVKNYEGFDWENGTKILVKHTSGRAFVITPAYRTMWDSHLDDDLVSWTHTDNIMVVTVEDMSIVRFTI